VIVRQRCHPERLLNSHETRRAHRAQDPAPEYCRTALRVTGQGIYRDSVLTAYPVPFSQPVLNAEVLRLDTVRVVPYRGKLFWLWGDMQRAGGPFGNFSTTSATPELPGRGGLDPDRGVDLHYITRPDGFVKPMCNWLRPIPAVPADFVG
jgi:hypothetical protein